ncbi:FHA domain-containing protein [Streptomyces sp. NPDC002120]|uniref:ABC transporter ATP-binding protein/permease n=1 Tax=Streptomyces sp. NPDC002120 TaxID=3364631 RepID=UPI003676A689
MVQRPGVPTAPELVLVTDTGSVAMSPGRTYHVGRDPLCEICLEDGRVSWHHAVLRPEGDHWTVEDEHSTNGTWADGRRVHEWSVGAGSQLRFGDAEDGPRAVLVGPPPPPPPPPAAAEPSAAPDAAYAGRPSRVSSLSRTFQRPTTVRPLPARTAVRIGRDPESDLFIDDLTVSRRHAELRALADGSYEIADVGSHNGTYLNGIRLDRRAAPLRQGDIVGIGHSAFCLVGDQLEEYVDTGEVSLDVQDLTVAVDKGRKVLLDRVSFPVGAKCLLAVVGPSGAGKSTLLGALTGLRPADQGTVLYDGRDLYRDYAELRRRIGLVPQDDILHSQLTVRRALGYAAELRFPQDTAKAERQARVEEVIGELGLQQRADQTIHSLSGGQRKRVSVALELLTKPSLLFLDEPTSGLDPGMDRSVMHMLRGLADDGRTVIVVTHSVLNLDVCDRLLILAPGGRTAYFGPPEKALGFFGFEQWPEAYEAFENDQNRDWAGQYRASPLQSRYVDVSAGRPPPPPAEEAARTAGAVPQPPPKAQSWGSQLSTLIRRYAAVLSADRTFLAIMIGLPFVMGCLARALAGSALTAETGLNALFILVLGGVLTGSANAVRELVKERVIYQRERAVGLSRSAYLMSKVVVLGALTIAQAVVLTVVGLAGVDTNAPGGKGIFMPPLIEITLAVALLSFTSMLLGLMISALVTKEEATMPLLVLLTIVQSAFCGALLKISGVPVLEQLAWFVPARWAMGAMGTTTDIGAIVPLKITQDPLFDHKTSLWLLEIGMLLVLSALFTVLVARMLRRTEPAVMRK